MLSSKLSAATMLLRRHACTMLCAVGLSLVFVFRDALAYVTIGYTAAPSALGTSGLPLTVARVAVLVLLCAALSAKGDSGGPYLLPAPRLLFSAFLATLGICSIAVMELSQHGASDVAAVGQMLVGVGNVLLLVAFAEFVFGMPKSQAVGVFLLASYLYGTLRILLGGLSSSSALLLLAACPSLACVLLFESARVSEGQIEAKGDEEADSIRSLESPARRQRLLALCGLFVYAFLYGVLQDAWTRLPNGFSAQLAQAGSGLGIILGTGCAQAIWAAEKRKRARDAAPSSALPLLFMIVLYMSTFLTSELVPAFVVVLYMAQRLAFFLMWEVALDSGRAPGLRLHVFCLAQLSAETGMLLQVVLAVALGSQPGIPAAAGCLAAVLLLAVEVLGRVSAMRAEGNALPMSNRAPHASGAMAASSEPDNAGGAGGMGTARSALLAEEGALDEFALSCGLTPREREVLPYILMGRTADYIGEALVIAPTAAKTHVRNIYRKAGVSRRAELVEAVDALAGRTIV